MNHARPDHDADARPPDARPIRPRPIRPRHGYQAVQDRAFALFLDQQVQALGRDVRADLDAGPDTAIPPALRHLIEQHTTSRP